MKLATLKASHRDGQLVVVDRTLTRCRAVPDISPHLQFAMDHWDELSPRLEGVYAELNAGIGPSQPFSAAACAAPLPRAYQFVDGSAYLNHVQLVRRARGATVPDYYHTDPLMYQGGSDSLLGACDEVWAREADGIDFEAELAVVTGDLALGSDAATCARSIRLVMLMNDVSLRNLIPNEMRKEMGLIQAKPASSFSPVAVTPDELGDAWRDSKVHLPMRVHLNGEPFGKASAGEAVAFNFAQLIAHLARTRRVHAGSIVGGGTVSNKQDTLWGSSVAHGGVGYSCIAELRSYETIDSGQPATAYMRDGDRVRIEMLDADGNSVFGAIDNTVRDLDR